MARRANPTVIGAFVVIALVLAVAGTLMFGSGRLFAARERYVLYFRESLTGLTIGAPVTLHGVQIGSVSSISVQVSPKGPSYLAPVVIEVSRSTFRPARMAQGAKGKRRLTQQQAMSVLIKNGLRGQLETRSYITGLLEVSLDFYPGTPVTLIGTKGGYPEIPTIPTRLEKLSRTLENLPIQQLVDNLLNATQKADELLSSPHLTDTLALIDQNMKNLSAVTANLDTRTARVTDDVRAALSDIRGLTAELQRQVGKVSDSAQATLQRGRQVLQHADSRIDPLAMELHSAVSSARTAMDAAAKALGQAGQAAAGLPAVEQELSDAIGEVASAARAVREFADYLERHPESLLHGKGGD